MPKVINQTGVSIDSLQAKLTLLESQFTKLSSEHKVVLDSLRSLDKTIQKADIATTFYDTHLATYTAIFGALIAILGLISLGWIKKRFEDNENRIIEVSNELLPQAVADMEEFHDSFKIDIQKESDKIKSQADQSLSWGLKSLIIFHETNKNYSAAILFMFRYMEFLVDINENPNENNLKAFEYLTEAIHRNLYSSNFKQKHFTKFEEELIKIFNKIKESKADILRKFYYSEILPFLEHEETPTSAIDVDQEAGEESEPSQD